MITFSQLLLVGLGGFFGSILRASAYLCCRANWLNLESYHATFFVNILGSLLIGLLAGYLSPESTSLRSFLLIGALGGFTTFSTFSFELLTMLNEGNWTNAFAFALASVTLGLAAAFIGFRIAAFI
ncbi:UNVERIFIED_CONTAM: hypothetical protein GTU68_009233 [Idotea baltica]|nr:hypothetical protein [Idotea baltica]